MSTKISLNEVVEAFDTLADGVDCYLNRTTGQICPVTDDDRFLVESAKSPENLPQWQREALPLIREVLDSSDWLKLPDRYQIHEWSIMDRFCRTQDSEARDELLDAIHGRGAFRAFRAAVERLGLRGSWFAYRRHALEEIASAWLEEHDLSWE